MRISRFVHVISDTEIWDAINKKFIKLDKSLIEFISDNKENYKLNSYPEKLLKLGVVVDEKDELRKIELLANQTTDTQIQSLYLMTTTYCNLDCNYCFYRSGFSESLKNRQNMSFDMAKKAIDKFYDIVSKNKVTKDYWQQITFYGGEPFINKDLLVKAIPYAKNKFRDEYTTIVINTNLVLLDKELINILKENDVEVQVSIDGNKEHHDLYRKTIKGEGTYDIVFNNISKLLESGIKVLPMITANDSNVKSLNNIILEIVTKLKLDDYAVNILITNSFDGGGNYPVILSKQMLKAYRQFGHIAKDYAFVELYEKLLNIDNTIAKNSCGATRKITVFPNGQVFSCQALEKVDINRMGDISSDFIDNKNFELWKKRNRFYKEECLKCEVVSSCGGGCATGSYNGTGSIYGIDYNQCIYTKSLFKQLLEERQK